MFSNLGLLLSLGSALLHGESNKIEEMILKKVESMGEKFLEEFLSDNVPVLDQARRAREAVESGGVSELARMREELVHEWTKSPHVPGDAVAKKLTNAFFKNGKNANNRTGPNEPRSPADHMDWAQSRQHWLDQSWKHDWHTQPRDPHGRWMPGRLRSPYVSKGARRMRRKRRALARKTVKEFFRQGEN